MSQAYSQLSIAGPAYTPAAVGFEKNRTFQQFVQYRRQPDQKFSGKEPDLYRETPVRLLVFCNDIGEAFKLPLLKWFGHNLGTALYHGSYAVTGAYVAMDTFDKGYKAYKKAGRQLNRHSVYDITAETIGAGLFQFFAGYWIPVKIVHAVRKNVQSWLHARTVNKFSHNTRLNLLVYVPAGISALTIPVIVKPIDYLVEQALHHTYWKGIKALAPE